MRALDPEVFDALWAAIEPLIPTPSQTHPLGCHRPRSSDRDGFRVMLVRLATGCSWEDAERPCGNKVSDTTKLPMGLRWPVERTNSWFSNFGQLRRNTDRSTLHRLAQLALAVTFLLTAKLADWRNRWSPDLSPIR